MDKTNVIFRKFTDDGTVIAIFPELPGDNNPYRTCLSYQRVGQHGAIVVDFHSITSPAKPEEYANLLDELIDYCGYDVRIAQRMTRKDLQARVKACEV